MNPQHPSDGNPVSPARGLSPVQPGGPINQSVQRMPGGPVRPAQPVSQPHTGQQQHQPPVVGPPHGGHHMRTAHHIVNQLQTGAPVQQGTAATTPPQVNQPRPVQSVQGPQAHSLTAIHGAAAPAVAHPRPVMTQQQHPQAQQTHQARAPAPQTQQQQQHQPQPHQHQPRPQAQSQPAQARPQAQQVQQARPQAQQVATSSTSHSGPLQAQSAEVQRGLRRFNDFRTKLFSLAKEDKGISDLWYHHGRKVRELHPSDETKDLLPRIVKAVYDAAQKDQVLWRKINSHVVPPQPQRPSQTGAAQAGQQSVQGQQAQPGISAVRPGAGQPVRPVGPSSGQQVQAVQAVHGGAQPGAVQGTTAAPMYQGARYPQGYTAAQPGGVQMQQPYHQYPYQQVGGPGMPRPGYPTHVQQTPEQMEAERKRREEELERHRQDQERQRREKEEKRRQFIAEQERKSQEREQARLAMEAQKAEKKRQQELEKQRRLEEKERKKAERKRKVEEEREKKKQEREREKARKAAERAASKGGRRKPAASKSETGDAGLSSEGGSLVPQPGLGAAGAKKRPGSRQSGGAKKKTKVDSDAPTAIPIDMDTEDAALLNGMLKLGQQHGHKSVLDEGAVLNDAPLRARLVHVAAGHGVRLVHSSAVKVCSVAVEVYLRDIVQQMLRMHSIRTRQAKDMPGMARDTSRNWAREVAIIAEEEKEAQARARQAQQLQLDQQTIAAHQNRRRGAELDEEEKAKRKETVDAAKSRLGTAEAQSRVNESLQKILPVRRFGQGRRLFGGNASSLRGAGFPNVKAKPGSTQGASGNGDAQAGKSDAGSAPTRSILGVAADGVKKKQTTLTMQDLLGTLRHSPVHAHSVMHYKLLMAGASAKA